MKRAMEWTECPFQYISTYRRAFHSFSQNPARARKSTCWVLPDGLLRGQQRGLLSLLRGRHSFSRLPHEVGTAAKLLANLCDRETLCQQTCRETLLLIQQSTGL
jgi:hypothetical protein